MENQPHQEPATPKEIWNILRAVSEKQKEASEELKKQMEETDRRIKETDRQLKEQIQENDRQLKERMQETDRRLKKLDEHFNSQWGKLMESLVEGDLVALLQAREITVERTLTNAKGTRNGHHYEFDILAVNGEQVVIVEVKTTLRSEDLTRFLEKLADFTIWAPEHKGKQVLGAVAYLKADSTVAMYAERQGLYVIRATGSSAAITNQADF